MIGYRYRELRVAVQIPYYSPTGEGVDYRQKLVQCSRGPVEIPKNWHVPAVALDSALYFALL